MRRITRL